MVGTLEIKYLSLSHLETNKTFLVCWLIFRSEVETLFLLVCSRLRALAQDTLFFFSMVMWDQGIRHRPDLLWKNWRTKKTQTCFIFWLKSRGLGIGRPEFPASFLFQDPNQSSLPLHALEVPCMCCLQMKPFADLNSLAVFPMALWLWNEGERTF